MFLRGLLSHVSHELSEVIPSRIDLDSSPTVARIGIAPGIVASLAHGVPSLIVRMRDEREVGTLHGFLPMELDSWQIAYLAAVTEAAIHALWSIFVKLFLNHERTKALTRIVVPRCKRPVLTKRFVKLEITVSQETLVVGVTIAARVHRTTAAFDPACLVCILHTCYVAEVS